MSRVSALMVSVALALTVGSTHAGSSLAEKCAAAKQKAAAKKIDGTLKCLAKATTNGTSVDPACVTKTETKFSDALLKVESKGGCVVTGDAAAIGGACDSVVNSIAALTPVVATTSTTITCPGATDCAGVCTNTNTDPRNCGGCGHKCVQGETCVPTSIGSLCNCLPPNTFCGGARCDILPCSCSNLQTDLDNCGACGNACPIGTDCQGGACVPTCGDDWECRTGYEFCCSHVDRNNNRCAYPGHCAPHLPSYPDVGWDTVHCQRSWQCGTAGFGFCCHCGGPLAPFCAADPDEAAIRCPGCNVDPY